MKDLGEPLRSTFEPFALKFYLYETILTQSTLSASQRTQSGTPDRLSNPFFGTKIGGFLLTEGSKNQRAGKAIA